MQKLFLPEFCRSRNGNNRLGEELDLPYLKSKFKTVLLIAVDIPLFTVCTVPELLESGAELACPVCGGQQGHSILLSSAVIEKFLSEQGKNGLRGAIYSSGIPVRLVDVSDVGILHDVDRPEDYKALLEYHNSHLIRPKIMFP